MRIKKYMIVLMLLFLSSLYAIAQDTIQKPCVSDSLKWERKVYENDIYKIVVSGYKPRLETVEIYVGEKVEVVYLIRQEDAKKRLKRRYKKR